MSGRAPDDEPRGRERIYAETLAELQARTVRLETQVAELTRQIASHGGEIRRLRLDRQLARIPRWLGRKISRALPRSTPKPALGSGDDAPQFSPRSSKRSLAVIVPAYPTAKRGYGGQPIERRVRFYKAAGFDVTIVVASNSVEPEENRGGVRVVHSRPEELLSTVEAIRPSQVCVHHPVPDHWAVAKEMRDRVPVHLWIHGYEARDWRELEFNYTAQEKAESAHRLDAITFDRRQAIREAFVDGSVTKIFVSDFMRHVAEEFAGIPAENSLVIHNVIDTGSFAYAQKTAPDRGHILSVRSFSKRNYATDLIRETIELLAHEAFFDDLTFSIFGDGQHFDEDTDALRRFPNVRATRRFLDSAAMASEFGSHGIMLIPTRWDSQGMTMGEAMSAGLVPVTNRVAAIPEFVDDQSGVMADPEDAQGMAEGIARLYRDPELFLSISAAAAQRVRAQCGPESTVQLELELLEKSEANPSKG